METEKTLSEKESFELISKMIQSAKTTLSDDGSHYMIWGWGVFVAAAVHFVLLKTGYPNPWLAWAVLMPLCGVAAMFLGRRQERAARVKTFVEEYLGYLWIAFGISMIVVLTFMQQMGAERVYPVIMVLYGIGTFVSGGALKFMPLKVGGIICWMLAIIAIRVVFEYQLLLIAASVLFSYIIPGYLLRRKYHRETIIAAQP
ncbi:MAG TPA: hypothetical protein PLD84_08435 [Chitinophagales bacterium]|nr:hypothetical protein [Chitinophagales bacterium]